MRPALSHPVWHDGYYRMNCAALRRAIAETQPDLIHCHGIGETLRWYYDVCRESGVPTVMTLHGLNAQLPQVSKADAMSEVTFLREADAAHWPVSLISSGIKKRLYREPYSLTDGASIDVILNGVAMHPAVDLPDCGRNTGFRRTRCFASVPEVFVIEKIRRSLSAHTSCFPRKYAAACTFCWLGR